MRRKFKITAITDQLIIDYSTLVLHLAGAKGVGHAALQIIKKTGTDILSLLGIHALV
jgi:NADPH:quinone reductase-like Zn-dependent oxidoreductase